MHIHIARKPYGVDPRTDRPVNLYTFQTGDDHQVVASITDYGATVVAFHTADPHAARDSSTTDVVLGYKDLVGFIQSSSTTYYGSTAGRCCGRIPEGKACLVSKGILPPVECVLTQNDGTNHLHGGRVGFSSRVWDGLVVDRDTMDECRSKWWWQGSKDETLCAEGPVLVLELLSPDGEEGYPGNLHVAALYTVGRRREAGSGWVSTLAIEYRAKLAPADTRPTIVNLTNHTYFNLDPSLYGGGVAPATPDTHTLQLYASRFLPATPSLLHTGVIANVDTDAPFDFRAPKLLALGLSDSSNQLVIGKGYDHTFLVDGAVCDEPPSTGALRPCAQLRHITSGRRLCVSTTQPAVHFYSGNFISPDEVPLTNPVRTVTLQPRSGLCLETQRANSNLPSIVLAPGQLYREVTRFELHSQTE